MGANFIPHLILPPPAAWFDVDAAPVGVAGGQRCVHVNIGELRLGARVDQLQALLGSCVGIAMLWKKRGRCGLAHCLLPETTLPHTELTARYVSQAVPSLLRLMGACVADYPDIEVVVAGGGCMLDACSERFQIGQQNIAAAKKHLALYGLHVQFMDVGGKGGRTLTIDCATQHVRVSAIEKRARAVHHA